MIAMVQKTKKNDTKLERNRPAEALQQHLCSKAIATKRGSTKSGKTEHCMMREEANEKRTNEMVKECKNLL